MTWSTTMDELIAQVSQRTGLPPEQARAAAQAVLEHLKGRLPPAIAGHLDQLLAAGGSGGAAGQQDGALGELTKNLGGLFGR
jgi:hypothetical protein